jgi:hypothetical protein
MKKIVSIVFVGLFLLNCFGYYFIFSYNQDVLQNEMKSLIRTGYFKDQYEKLIISNPSIDPDFKWAEKGEFRYKGKLYDLIFMEVTGTTTVIICINDKKEEQLIARHDQFQNLLTSMNSPGRTKNTKAMQNLVIKQALLRNFLIQSPVNSTQVLFLDPTSFLNSITLTPASPPPRST